MLYNKESYIPTMILHEHLYTILVQYIYKTNIAQIVYKQKPYPSRYV